MSEQASYSGHRFVIRTANPDLLGVTLNGLPMVSAEVAADWDGEKVTVYIAGDPSFADFAITQQGYGEIVERPAGTHR